MKNKISGILLFLIISIMLFAGCNKQNVFHNTINSPIFNTPNNQYLPRETASKPTPTVKPSFQVEKIIFHSDKDKDGIADADDFVQGARVQVEKKPRYVADYFKGGYPPEDIAVCTDIVWRALKNAGYDLKTMVDTDIKSHIKDYPRVEGKPDPNIDFRRVLNLVPFFKKYGTPLTKEIKPYDEANLIEWQHGDFVVFYWGSIEHIAVVSDQRNEAGVPYLIHTYGSYPMEDDRLLDWADTIAYHFRYPKYDAK